MALADGHAQMPSDEDTEYHVEIGVNRLVVVTQSSITWSDLVVT